MKKILLSTLVAASGIGAASADLYYIPGETQESSPLRWSIGADATWDNNVTPTSGTDKDEAFSINPYVGLSFASITPQSSLDVYARLGAIYYFDKPDAMGSDDIYAQARLGVNFTHRVNERLRFSTRNFISYELEPDYAQGIATTRQVSEYLYAETDNSVGYRWTERFATYTGFTLSWLDYGSEVHNQDRFSWTLYNQFRYQLTPQTVLTADYRYTDTDADGLAADSTSHYFLVGAEHRFSPNTILVVRAGAQIYEADGGSDNTSPYVELALNTRINEQFSIRSFARYGLEGYDTVRTVDGFAYNFDERRTFRLGVSGTYTISPMFSIFGGVDYIPTTFDDGRNVGLVGPSSADGLDEDVLNLYVGLSVKFTEMLYGTLSYNYTDSDSDFANQSYDRSRVSVGIRAEF